jgi:hypothetical protein
MQFAAGARIQVRECTLLLYFLNFSSAFREMLRGLFNLTGTCKHHLKGFLAPFVSALKGINFLFATCQKGLATACKIQKIRENKRVLHAVVEFLPAACKRVSDYL